MLPTHPSPVRPNQHHSRWPQIGQLTFLFILTLLIVTSLVTCERDPYEVLGVRREASLSQIKKAYRDQARKLHPDKSNTSNREESSRRFIELNKAFNLLKDPIRRSRYDRFGEIDEKRRKVEVPSLSQRIYTRFVDTVIRVLYYLTSRESFSAMMILVACASITSIFLYKSPVPSQFSNSDKHFENYYQSEPPSGNLKKNSSRLKQNDELKIIELKAETYNGMVRLLKPGCRSIIVLVDQESKEKLLEDFKKAVRPYRRNKTLLFGYLCLDKNLMWYKTLLEQMLGCENLKLNKKNCIGTVLSLNGFKKYLRVYHDKHHEIDYYDDETDNDGSFLGFDAGDDDLERGVSCTNENYTKDVNNAYTDKLLEKLPIWLDKMFDGLTKRYFIDEWPDEIN
jgi:curved DNA-binding protein CbpA